MPYSTRSTRAKGRSSVRTWIVALWTAFMLGAIAAGVGFLVAVAGGTL